MNELDPSIKLTYFILMGVFVLFILFIIIFVIIYKSKQTSLYNENLMKEALLERQKLAAEIDRIKALQDERDRIAIDMHDDLGSGLSSIKLISEMLKRKHKEPETQNDLNEIVAQAGELIATMREMVWSLNPRQDSLPKFVTHIQQYTKHFFEPSTINCTIQIAQTIPDLSMSGFTRRNVLLCYKEVLNNIIKHAQASEVHIKIELVNRKLSIEVADNGIGLAPSNQPNNGFYNMQKRMKDCKGSIEWKNTSPGLCTLLLLPLEEV